VNEHRASGHMRVRLIARLGVFCVPNAQEELAEIL
jgi:hypothetical protein